jgi:Ca-activated chloride channel family protein
MRKYSIALAFFGILGLSVGCGGDAADYGGASDDGGNDTGWGTGGDGDGDGDGDGEGGDDEGGDPDPDPEDKPEPDPEPVCDLDNDVTVYLSPDDSNSMSSPVQAREAMLSGFGHFPVRVWEFLNYYDFDYPIAEPGAVTVRAEMRAIDVEDESQFYLQIGVGSEAVTNEQRAPLNLTLVLDESGSMSGQPIDMLKESCRAIAASLREGDILSMVTWDTGNAVRLAGYEVSGPNDPKVVDLIEEISAGGGTDLHGGLVAGYELAEASYDPERINRIVLVSDGGANVGITDEELIGQKAGGEDAEGIYMVGVGVGTSGYNDLLMDRVTDLGKGASVFIPNEAEAWKVFNQNFVNTLDVAVRDVQVQLDMPPGFEILEFSGEEYSPDPQEIEPQHLAPNDSMVFLQSIGTCAPELTSDESELTVTVRYKDALTFEEHEVSVTKSFGQLLSNTSPELEKGLAVFRYAQALAGQVEVSEAEAQLEAAELLHPNDPDLAEIRSVIEAM